MLGGSIGEMHAKKIVSLYDMAMKMGAPVGTIDCAGLRLESPLTLDTRTNICGTDKASRYYRKFRQSSGQAAAEWPSATG